MEKPHYKRILLKISGEAFGKENGYGIHLPAVLNLADELVEVHRLKVCMALVVGGGNIFRGLGSEAKGMDRASSDYMGMLATCINALALQDALQKKGLCVRVQTALRISEVTEPYIRGKALSHLKKGRIVIFAAGTGNPYFSTDTAAALRAMEIGADILLKATKVEGVYEKDPLLYPDSHKYDRLHYIDVLKKGLKIMDSTAVSLCMDNKMPVVTFNMRTKGNIKRIIQGEKLGTLIK